MHILAFLPFVVASFALIVQMLRYLTHGNLEEFRVVTTIAIFLMLVAILTQLAFGS